MFTKIMSSAALLAGIAAAQNVVINYTPQDIQYGYTGPYDAMLGSGVIPANGGSVQFDLGESRNVKMCFTCSDPAGASSGIYQFEYDFDSNANQINYDWSNINGPDDFLQYQRTITPSNPDACPTISCAPGDDSNDCQYESSGDFNPPNCPAGGAPTLTATIGTPPSKARRHAKAFRV